MISRRKKASKAAKTGRKISMRTLAQHYLVEQMKVSIMNGLETTIRHKNTAIMTTSKSDRITVSNTKKKSRRGRRNI